jgi:pilus assembly protein Flp/PilA
MPINCDRITTIIKPTLASAVPLESQTRTHIINLDPSFRYQRGPGNSEERRRSPMLFAPQEKGQGLVEYALILVLVAIVVIAALMILGPIIGNTFSTINNSLNKV